MDINNISQHAERISCVGKRFTAKDKTHLQDMIQLIHNNNTTNNTTNNTNPPPSETMTTCIIRQPSTNNHSPLTEMDGTNTAPPSDQNLPTTTSGLRATPSSEPMPNNVEREQQPDTPIDATQQQYLLGPGRIIMELPLNKISTRQ